MGSRCKAVGNLIRIIGFVLVAAAVYQELKKPPEERKWHGKLAGFIPYDFRRPSIERFKQRLWNPEDPRIFTEHVFGVGWSINFYSLRRKLEAYSQNEKAESSDDPA